MGFNIAVNKKVEILWAGKIYKSIIQDINEDKEYLAILPPIKDGIILPLHNGDEFQIIYYSDKDIYQFKGVVKGRRYEAKVELLIVSYSKNYIKIQRREFVRVNIAHLVNFVRVSNTGKFKDGENILKDGNGKSGIIMDISGGGMRLKANEKLNLEDILVLEFELNNTKFIIMGKVVRDEKDDSGIKIYGVAYVDLDEKTRDKIIKLIFDILRMQSKTV